MRTPLTVESLVDADVLESTRDDEFSLSPEFEETLATHRDRTPDSLLEALEDRFEGVPDVATTETVDDSTAEFVAILCAIADHVEGVAFERAVSAGFVVNQLVEGPFREAGAPDGFVPVSGRQLGVVEAVCGRAVVYVWREDCEPCDAMRDTLESMRDRFPDDVARFAVYGPASARHLHETYDVQGGPATLFVADGGVQSRLYGAHYEEVIESELAALAEEPEAEPN